MARKKGPAAAPVEEVVVPFPIEEVSEPEAAPEPARRRDIVVIGASSGGVRALRELVAGFPPELPASLFVVLHVSPEGPSFLPDILSAAGPLPAAHAENGDAIDTGRIYVAPPDMHLLLEHGRVRVVHGPKENRHRPAIDPLFRSAALAYGPRVVGVVLSGILDDGSAGLAAIHSQGGTTIVQDPAEAVFSQMPRSALKRLEVDHCLRLPAIAALITRLSREPVREGVSRLTPAALEKESRVALLDPDVLEDEEKPGKPSPFTCPECSGVLWGIEEGDALRFRCRVGHAYSSESMVEAQGESLERALWTALRMLEERIALLKRIEEDAVRRSLSGLAKTYEERREEAEKNAASLRQALLRNPKE